MLMYYQQQGINNIDALNYILRANENRFSTTLGENPEINNNTPKLKNIYRLFKDFI